MTAAHCLKMVDPGIEKGLNQFVRIADQADDTNCKISKSRADKQRLRVRVADAADTEMTVHLLAHSFEFSAEGRIRDIVYIPLEPIIRIIRSHAGALRSQMGMIVNAEENVLYAVLMSCDPKETAHQAKKSSESVMGWMYSPSL